MSEDSKILYGNVQQLTTEPDPIEDMDDMRLSVRTCEARRTNSSSSAPRDAGKGMDWDAVEARVRDILCAASPDEMLMAVQGWMVELRRRRAPIGAGPTSRMLTPARVAEIQERIDRDECGFVNYGEMCAFVRAWQAARAFVEYDGAHDNPDYVHYQEHFDAMAAAVGVAPAGASITGGDHGEE